MLYWEQTNEPHQCTGEQTLAFITALGRIVHCVHTVSPNRASQS